MTHQTINMILEYLSKHPIKKQKSGRPVKKSDRWYLERIFAVLKSGMPWRYASADGIHYTTIYRQFRRWADMGIFREIFATTLQKLRKVGKLPLNDLAIDSTLIKNQLGQDCLGRNSCDRGRKGCKISLVVTDQCIPLIIHGSPANIHDSQLVIPTLDQVPINIKRNRIIGDKAYNSKPLKEQLRARQLTLIYPLKTNQKGRARESERKKRFFRSRNSVERVFGWVKKNRRLCLRYEAKMHLYMEFWYLALLQIVVSRTS